MNDWDIIWLILFGLGCFSLGRWYQIHVMIKGLLNNHERVQKLLSRYAEEDAQAEAQVVAIRAEWVGDQVYLYRDDTQEFLAQGLDVHTAIGNITKLTPGVSYEIPADMAKKPEQIQP
jgi:hypothetical protein